MRALQSAMDKEIALQQQGDAGALARRDKTAVGIADLRSAKEKLAASEQRVRNDAQRDAVYLPREAVASQTQSILQRYVVLSRSDLIANQGSASDSLVPFTSRLLRGEGKTIVDLFSHFGPADIGW